jgi:sugar O-acyltransferase (sialic acid O-acetyltransferase NeuD family)
MPDHPSLVIVGAGGFGREVAALVEAVNRQASSWSLAGFVDDDPSRHGDTVMGYSVRGDVYWLAQQTDLRFVIAIGDGAARRRIAERLRPSAATAASLLHPSVSIHRTAEVAPGTIACRGVASTVHFEIGPHVILNLNCTIGHDSVLGAFVTLHPGVHVSGAVHLAAGVTLGTGAVVLPGVRIGAHTTVGAGAVVTDDLPPHCTAVGTPARPQS